MTKHKTKPERADAENPEWTEEMFANAVRGTTAAKRKRGRPKSDRPKEQVTLRLSPEVLEYFRAGGKGWQTRIDETLKRVAEQAHPS